MKEPSRPLEGDGNDAPLAEVLVRHKRDRFYFEEEVNRLRFRPEDTRRPAFHNPNKHRPVRGSKAPPRPDRRTVCRSWGNGASDQARDLRVPKPRTTRIQVVSTRRFPVA